VARFGLHECDGWFDPDHNVFRPTSTGTEINFLPGQIIRVRSLDSFLAERPGIDRVDWIKIDVEGAELGVLRGGERTLKRYKPNLLVELHEFHRADISLEVWSYLSALGYSCDGPYKHCAVSHAFYEIR
jgi:hypothetical protein